MFEEQQGGLDWSSVSPGQAGVSVQISPGAGGFRAGSSTAGSGSFPEEQVSQYVARA